MHSPFQLPSRPQRALPDGNLQEKDLGRRELGWSFSTPTQVNDGGENFQEQKRCHEGGTGTRGFCRCSVPLDEGGAPGVAETSSGQDGRVALFELALFFGQLQREDLIELAEVSVVS